jgi:MFS family permease
MEAPVSPLPASEAEIVPAGPDRLWNRSFFLLWLGQTISQLGNPAFSIGAMLWMKEATGSASLMGLLMTASAVPALLLSPFGGTFADRHSRVRIMIWTDLVSGLVITSFAVFLWLRPHDTALGIPLLFAGAFIVGIVRAFFMPAAGALIPDLVPKGKLSAANSLNQLSIQGSLFSGQALGGILYKIFGAALLFGIDGVSYLIAAVFTLFIPRDVRTAPSAAAGAQPFSFQHFLGETADGFRYVWAQKGQRDFLFTASLLNFLAVTGLVLFPFYVERYLNVGASWPSWYGFLTAGVSVGLVVGFVGAGAMRLTGEARARGVLTALVLYPVFFGSLTFWRQPVPALIAVVLGGMTTGFINVYLISLAQASTPDALRGRVMAFLGILTGGLMPLGMALGGIAGDLTDKNAPLVIGVCAILAMLVVLLLGFRRPCREYLAS